MKKCISCNKENATTYKFCIYCGTKFQEKKEKPKSIESDYDKVLKNNDGTTIALLAKVAKVTGSISKVEATMLSHFIDIFILHHTYPKKFNIRDIYKEIITKEKNRFDNIELLSYQIHTQKDKISLINSLLSLAYIDGVMQEKQENLILRVVHTLSINLTLYQSMRKIFEPKEEQNHQQNNQDSNQNTSSVDNNYEILEVSPNHSNQEIKKSYRRLVQGYHSDILASKNLPQDMIDFAEEKLKKINNAYEVIKKQRGI